MYLKLQSPMHPELVSNLSPSYSSTVNWTTNSEILICPVFSFGNGRLISGGAACFRDAFKSLSIRVSQSLEGNYIFLPFLQT